MNKLTDMPTSNISTKNADIVHSPDCYAPLKEKKDKNKNNMILEKYQLFE